MSRLIRIAALPAFAAAFALGAPQALAAPVTSETSRTAYAPADPVWSDAEQTFERHRRYRGHRYRGYRGYGHRYRNRTSVGDVIAGAVILGGIAAVINSTKRNREDRDYRRDGDYRNQDYRRDRRGNTRQAGASGLDRAASQCVREIERDVRVNEVESVQRTGEGWFVRGSLYDGASFTCTIDPNGRIDRIDYSGEQASRDVDGRFAASSVAVERGQQWDDARYAEARRDTRIDTPAAAPVTILSDDQPAPAYPGGPLPGETPDDIAVDGDLALATP